MSVDIQAPDDQEDLLFEHHRITVDEGQHPLRVDKFLGSRLAGISRARIQAGIESGFVRVNEHTIRSNYKIQPGDTVVIALPVPPRDTTARAENIPLDVVYEDDNLLVVNKPAGMVVHPAHQNWTGTLVNALLWRFSELPQLPGNQGRPGLVHRIDKDTSGLVVIAKDERTLTGLAKQFFDHSIHRTYWALVWGEPWPASGTINVSLGRSSKDRRVVVPYADGAGQRAVTHYEVIESLRYVSVVACRLETGRTHQIRAHLAYLGHPIFNDVTYGGDRVLKGTVTSSYKQFIHNCFECIPRQALHARTLGFVHPITQEKLNFNSDLPRDFNEVLFKWRNYVQYR